ncbi:rapamycin-insensitive companion of mTOR-like [Pomacea canaliculata]|uniref:rapamycin-insensitive companion of mTOR-like n=1 Tax=Pomacea canaliculata TaxID=400727 RepID=UPI000D7394CD|nr:rapamycin-insensitive companion of mTOR-like [Pomacea canaliculata]
MAAVANQGRGYVRRIRVRHESGEEVVRLKFDRDPAENVKEILTHVVVQHGVSKARKLAYLNSFVKLIHKQAEERGLGVGSIEILACLQIGLLHEAKEVRAATLRVLRHLLQADDMLSSFLALRMDYLVMRSLDVCLDNEIERIHAIKLIRQLNTVAPEKLPRSLLFSIVAIGNNGASERDQFVRVCLATLCEIAFRNVDLVSKCGGISTLLWNILDCHQFPRLNESLTCTVLYLMNHPRSRVYIRANTDLEQLLAPLTDSHFRYSGESSDQTRSDDRETRFIASKMAAITLMQSWPGLIRLCHPEGSGLQSLIGILYLPYIEIRKYILELISDLFRLPLPDWTDDFHAALLSVDPCEMKDSWKLSEGFVAEEGRSLLPHCAATRPNLIDNHLALLLSAWISAGVLEALIEVITTSEGALFVRAVILLGELLYVANALLPSECCSHSHCLPSLLSLASMHNTSDIKQQRASVAMQHLSSFHTMKKRGFVPCSLFLDQLLHFSGKFMEISSRRWHLQREKLSEYYFKKMQNDEHIQRVLRDSLVLQTKENAKWQWDLICCILKWPDERLRKLEDQTYVRFLRRLLFFFKPTNHLFSHMKINSELGHKICLVGCYFVEFLVSVSQEETQKMITELLIDIAQCLTEVSTQRAVPESVFGANSIYDTLSQYYFLFLGCFSTTRNGTVHLEKTGVFQSLLEIMSPMAQEMYVKLIVSSLSYSCHGSAQAVLSKALTSTPENCRLYATRLLRVLLRSGMQGFNTWGLELLVTQLYDQSKSVAMAALTILDEACDIEVNLQQLIRLRPSLLHLGERGVLLLCRFLSLPSGFRTLRDANFLTGELEKWRKTYNTRYVHIVEEMLNEALTTYEKPNRGMFMRRSMLKGPKKDVFLPTHLYGQLVQHEEGLELLKKEGGIHEYFSVIRSLELREDSDILKLKTALWAVGHIGSSAYGVSVLEEENVVPELIRLAEECGVFSIRGTAFYVLGLVASNRRGTDILVEYGWESQCRTRAEAWPVLDYQGLTPESFGEAIRLSKSSSMPVEVGRMSSHGSTHLSFIKEENVRLDHNGDPAREAEIVSDSGLSIAVRSEHTCSGKENNNNNSLFSSVMEHELNMPRSTTLPGESLSLQNFPSEHTRSFSERHIGKHCLPLGQLSKQAYERACSIHTKQGQNSVILPQNIDMRFQEVVSVEDSSWNQNSSSYQTCELVASPVIQLADSVDEPATSEICDNKSKEAIFHIGSVGESGSGSSSSGGGVTAQKEDHSSSDISQRSKSRASSFNTDSTTSGVSSCESNMAQGTSAVLSSLSPIPSSSSISTLSATPAMMHITTTSSSVSHNHLAMQELAHPSAAQRRLNRLTRIPSLHRRPASQAIGSLQSLPGSVFSTYRDVLGYATLRHIRRQRAHSNSDAETEGSRLHEGVPESFIKRTISMESDTSVDSNIWLSIRRNVSSASLADPDHNNQQLISSSLTSFKPLSSHNRFVGITLPVDVNMIFEVIEGEDGRSTVDKQKSPEQSLAEKLAEVKVSVPVHIPPLTKEATFEHSKDMCLLCTWTRQRCFKTDDAGRGLRDISNVNSEVDSAERKDSQIETVAASKRDYRLRGGSMNEQSSSATPGSQTSTTSFDSASKKLTEDNEEGRRLIRSEVLRLIVNLSSSVGLKASEQGLLSLKQQFPSMFKDICFFSEVCLLLSSYSFRLN